LLKDLKTNENRNSALKTLIEVKKKFSEGIPLLDPIEDMRIDDPNFVKLIRKDEKLEDKEPLSRYKIKSDDTLILDIPTRGPTGGTRITAPDVNKQVIRKTGKNNLLHWNVNQVTEWLKKNKLESCLSKFQSENIDGIALLELSTHFKSESLNDIREIGKVLGFNCLGDLLKFKFYLRELID